MADPRAELEQLRKLKRLKELEAKAGGADRAPAAAAQAPSTSAPQAALEGFGQTASMGYLPQLQAGAEKGVDKLQQLLGVGAGGVDADLRSQGFKLDEKPYVQMRDENIARQALQGKENPGAALAGKLAGAVVGGVATSPLLPGKAATLAGNVGRGAFAGAAQGAMYNPGDKEGVVDFTQGGERIPGALAGAVVGGAMPVVAEGAKGLANFLMKKALNIKTAPHIPKDIGNQLVDQGLMGSRSQMADQIERKLAQEGSNLTKAVGQIDQPISTAGAAAALQGKAGNMQIGGITPPNAANISNQYTQLAEDLANRGEMSAQDLLAYKQLQGDLSHSFRGNPLTSDSAEAAKAAMWASKDALTKAALSKDPAIAEAIRSSNQNMSTLYKGKQGLDMAEGLSNQLGNLKMQAILGALGGAAGGLPGAVAGAALNSPMTQSTAAQALQKLVAPGAEQATPVLLRSLFEGMR